MKKAMLMFGAILAAALPLWAGTGTDPRGSVALDALEPGALAGRVQRSAKPDDPREWYFVITRGPDPDFAGMGATLDAAWKNRRLVRVPPQAVKGLARHPGVLYLQRIETASSQGQASATAGLEAVPEATPAPVSATSELGTLTWTTGPYDYDGAGNIEFIGPDHWGRTQEYRYDGVGRLTFANAHTSLESHTEEYEYDAFGNLISKKTDGEEGLWVSPNPATNQLTGPDGTSGGSYDEAGNLTGLGSSWYFWDGGGMLKEMWYGSAGQNGYVYTPEDERLGVVTSAGVPYWTWTIRDFGGKVIREFESSGMAMDVSPWLWVEDYAHGLGRMLVAEREGANGGRRHYHADHLGTTRLVTTDDGAVGVTAGDGYYMSEHVYYPFGVEASELLQEHALGNDRETRLKYTGHERDYLGGETVENTNYIDYMHARYYNPNLGRFLSVDPVLDLKRSIREPQSWNRYSYVVNNPIRRIDPDGRVDGNSDDFAQQLFPDDRGAQREFDQGVAENLAIGAATVVGGIAGWAARGVLTTAVLSPRLALTAGSILASMAGQPTVGGIRSVVVPGGTKIGVEGTSGAIRFMKGGFAEAKAMFQSLAKGGTVTKLGKDVLTVDLKGVGQVTLRTVSSTEGVRATVQLNVKGVGVREIKYVDEILK